MNYSCTVKVVWDESKSRTNRKKHGVSFEEASALFHRGDDYLEIFDDATPMKRTGSSPSDLSRRVSFLSCTRSVMRTRFASSAPVGRQNASRVSIGTTSKEERYDGHS